MTRRSLRRSLAASSAALVAAGVMGLTLGGSASAEVPSRTRSQVATPPAPGSGIQITVGGQNGETGEPQPVGPLSFT